MSLTMNIHYPANLVKIYLAGGYPSRHLLEGFATVLQEEPQFSSHFFVVSTWHENPSASSNNYKDYDDTKNPARLFLEASNDLQELGEADVLVLFPDSLGKSRGGKYFEAGFALGAGKEVVCLGPPESVFDHHPRLRAHRIDLNLRPEFLRAESKPSAPALTDSWCLNTVAMIVNAVSHAYTHRSGARS